MCINHINDDISTDSYMNKYADDAEIQRKIDENSCVVLENGLTKIHEWQIKLNSETNIITLCWNITGQD